MSLLLAIVMSLSSVNDIKVSNCYMVRTRKVVVVATDKEGVLFRYTTDINGIYWSSFDAFIYHATPTECYGK